MNQVNNESQIKESNDYIHCKLCNVYIKRFKQHSKSKKHIKIRDELLRIRKASIYCQVCNSHSKNFNQHLKSNKHRKRKKVVEFYNKYKCNCIESQSAVNGLFKEYKYNNIDTSNYKEYLETIKNHVRDQLEGKYTEWPNPQITENHACDRQSGLNDSAPRNHILAT